MWRHREIRTLPDIVRFWARRTPAAVALRAGDEQVTYAELESRTNRLAHALAERVEPGGTVCFIGKNSPEFWESWFATGKAGAAFVPLNWRCAVPELVELLADAGAPVVLVDSEYADTMGEVAERLGRDVELVVLTPRSTGGAGFGDWCAGRPDMDPGVAVHGEDTALIAYTSGTTGRPKGVMVLHEAFDLFFLSDELEPTIRWSSDDLVLMVMPNFHLAGSWVSLPALYHGGTVATIPAFVPSATVDGVERFRPTVLCLVPAAIQAVLDDPATDSADLSSIRTLVYAGSAIGSQTITRALEVFGCELRQFYGTTETYIISILRPDDHDVRAPGRLSSCGAPVPLVEVRLVDASGRDVGDDEVGQVLVRSPMVMAGYHGQPEATSAAIDADGWYSTGDLGRRDADGFHHLVDRVKDMVVTGGENVYSVEVERALLAHPEVALAAVIGTPSEKWGEAVTAYVVPVPGASPAPDALRDHCRGLIAGYKVPKVVEVRDGLPMTPMGKVRKVDLRQEVSA